MGMLSFEDARRWQSLTAMRTTEHPSLLLRPFQLQFKLKHPFFVTWHNLQTLDIKYTLALVARRRLGMSLRINRGRS